MVGKAFTSFSIVEKETELGIENYTINTGIVSKDELIDLYNLADVFVFPSLYEGFGIPPLEAMACGTPVIAANNSSIPEVVGDAAILFDARDVGDLSDKIRMLINDVEMRDKLKERGKIRSKIFSWEQTVDEVRTVIESVV